MEMHWYIMTALYQDHKNMDKNGFTLLEVMIVLAIWSVLLLLTTPIIFSQIDKQEEHRFFEVFQSDVLYIQSLAMVSKEEEVRIKFYDQSYSILQGRNKTVARAIPSDWQVNTRILSSISFNEKGTIRQPGTIEIKTTRDTYHIIFPFGKGRCYIVKK